jgi:hypothetical protein
LQLLSKWNKKYTHFNQVAIPNYVLMVGTMCFILLPYILLVVRTFGSPDAKWTKSLVLNVAVIISIIGIEIFTRNFPADILPFQTTAFAIVNVYEANVIMLLMDDFKATLYSAKSGPSSKKVPTVTRTATGPAVDQ